MTTSLKGRLWEAPVGLLVKKNIQFYARRRFPWLDGWAVVGLVKLLGLTQI